MKYDRGPIAQSVVRPTADPGLVSFITAWSHTFIEIDHNIISSLSPPSADSRRDAVSYKSESMCMKLLLTA